jgi:hypothetical protein
LEGKKPFEGFNLERKPGRPVNPKRAKAPTWIKTLGGKEGHGFLSGRNPLERRYKAGRFCRRAPERKVGLGTI